ncbi:hypothetical protein FA002_11585 [Priestia megaterium]|uniref:hypothetical protein n=1 Tax=Priestia megaterium TaxID=1404 RepID=UPI0010AC94A0|nr:hypothetical protein [Priestia megaterium]TJZ36455.1 hypothetical protein FA002_11585 [Priestia megaterium]
MNFRQLSLVIVFSCILILLASCSEEDKSLRFEGESENWKSQYFLTQDKDKENGEGSIIYKGPNKDNIGEVTYKIEGSYGSIDVTSTPVDGKMGINDACEGCAKQDSSDPFHVTIKWEGKTEKFDLKAK